VADPAQVKECDYAVIGGGLVGMAIAYGLVSRGHDVTVFDEGDVAFRASRGNFGLVWVQGKGLGMPDYARWSRLSAELWPELAAELADGTGLSLELDQPGGIQFFLSDDEAEEFVGQLTSLRDALSGDYPFEYLGHNAAKAMVPEIGPEVVGATYCPLDGHVNPLYLLRSLHKAARAFGARVVSGPAVDRIDPLASGFRIHRDDGVWTSQNIVLCAGLGNARLAPMVGLDAPVQPNRGQVLVTERVRPFIRYPSGRLRQVGEGAVQIGDSKEDVGLDDATTGDVVGSIANRAVRCFPLLENVRVVRSWGALRVMSPDGHPIYERSTTCSGASLVTCHSGVTLAAVHAKVLAGWVAGGESIVDGDMPNYLEKFGVERFKFQKAG
jgi:glycine/D-amino acid oxidase-like deaminating enzyme